MELTQRNIIFFIVHLLALCFTYSVHGITEYEPQQVHIAIGETPDEMVIVWNTDSDTHKSIVKYGVEADKLDQTASGQSTPFVDGGEEKRTQFVHRVTLKGLAEETEYSYQVGSSRQWSSLYLFKTWPRGEDWSPRFAIFGDLGYKNAKSLPRLKEEVQQDMYDVILHVGDFAYNLDDDNGRVGDNFMRQIEPVASRVPYMTCPGNHEKHQYFLHYKNRFWMPGDENKKMYYSFTIGPVRILSLATEFMFLPSFSLRAFWKITGDFKSMADHRNWIERTLKEANEPENRAKHPWIITIAHRPMYCSNDQQIECDNQITQVRTAWEKMFMKYGVDVSIWGHQHSFERTWPVYKKKVKKGSLEFPYRNPKAPVHIITGVAGSQQSTYEFKKNPDTWSAFRSTEFSYTSLNVINKTHLYLEQVSYDKNNPVIDSMTLIQETHGKRHVNWWEI